MRAGSGAWGSISSGLVDTHILTAIASLIIILLLSCYYRVVKLLLLQILKLLCCCSDIYALTHTARMRRRAELGLDKLRISEMKDGESPGARRHSRYNPISSGKVKCFQQQQHLIRSPLA